jgi:Ala-tRNA(Pro) deacylase
LHATPDDLFALFRRLGIAARTYDHVPVFTVAESQAIKEEIPGGHSRTSSSRTKRAGSSSSLPMPRPAST